MTISAQRLARMQRVTIVGAAVNVILSALKIVFGWIGQSQALIADGVHSLADLISDGVVLLAAHHANRAPDEDHPYGHGRIETAGTVAISVLLALVAGGLIFDAVRRIAEPTLLMTPGVVALAVAAISIVAKEILYHYTRITAEQVRSDLMRANAWHHRSDAISSVVVVLGIGGSMAGVPSLDAVAAILVAAMIFKIAWDLGWSGMQELVDKGLEPERVAEIEAAINAVAGVEALHMLRTRRMGAEALADVHILVSPRISVSEGHQISEQVRTQLVDRFDEIADVTVHIDPEDDEEVPPTGTLTDRETLMADLRRSWTGIAGAGQVDEVVLHYLDGRIQVDVFLPLELAPNPEAGARLAREFAAADKPAEVDRVRVHFRASAPK